MSNTITIELCAEDRARLDRLTTALERLQPTTFITSDVEADPDQLTIDDVQQRLADTMAKVETPTEAPKNATEEAKAEALPIIPPEEEKPTAEETAPTEPAKPTVTLEQIQQKVVQLAAGNGGAKKAKVREIVNAYAKKVSDLPEDKWTEIWDKLTALESED
jgi:hypothetical protein